jgi:hypothetical protein
MFSLFPYSLAVVVGWPRKCHNPSCEVQLPRRQVKQEHLLRSVSCREFDAAAKELSLDATGQRRNAKRRCLRTELATASMLVSQITTMYGSTLLTPLSVVEMADSNLPMLVATADPIPSVQLELNWTASNSGKLLSNSNALSAEFTVLYRCSSLGELHESRS